VRLRYYPRRVAPPRALARQESGDRSSVMEANASLRALENRNTGEAYWEYVRRLAAEAGVDAQDAAAVRRFDKQRPGRKTSNQEWVNPMIRDGEGEQSQG